MTVWGPGMAKYGREGRPKGRKRTVSSVKKSCDKLWSKVVKTRAGWHCERCGAEPKDPRGFHSHHIYGRSNHRLRYEPRNGWASCARCHRWAHDQPLEFARWFQIYSAGTGRHGDYEWLRSENAKGLADPRSLSDYLELEAELKNLLQPVA